MEHTQGHEYAHNIARNYNKGDYEDVYQQAWLYLLEAEENGLKDQDCFWDARFRTNLWANYQNRLVPLPLRTGSKELAETQEVDHEVHDNTITTGDHAEAYELYREVLHLRNNIRKLSLDDISVLQDHYVFGMSWRDIAAKYGKSHVMWQKWHNEILNTLKGYQEAN